MTVQQLIEKLSTMPPDTPVVYSCFSEVIDLEEDDATLEVGVYVKRGDYYVTYLESQWDKREGEPQFVTVCHFPSN